MRVACGESHVGRAGVAEGQRVRVRADWTDGWTEGGRQGGREG